jgi:hypothetical protein
MWRGTTHVPSWRNQSVWHSIFRSPEPRTVAQRLLSAVGDDLPDRGPSPRVLRVGVAVPGRVRHVAQIIDASPRLDTACVVAAPNGGNSHNGSTFIAAFAAMCPPGSSAYLCSTSVAFALGLHAWLHTLQQATDVRDTRLILVAGADPMICALTYLPSRNFTNEHEAVNSPVAPQDALLVAVDCSHLLSRTVHTTQGDLPLSYLLSTAHLDPLRTTSPEKVSSRLGRAVGLLVAEINQHGVCPGSIAAPTHKHHAAYFQHGVTHVYVMGLTLQDQANEPHMRQTAESLLGAYPRKPFFKASAEHVDQFPMMGTNAFIRGLAAVVDGGV